MVKVIKTKVTKIDKKTQVRKTEPYKDISLWVYDWKNNFWDWVDSYGDMQAAKDDMKPGELAVLVTTNIPAMIMTIGVQKK